jgi:hypothetical protein
MKIPSARIRLASAAVVAVAAITFTASGAAPDASAPLQRPDDLRDLVFLTSGHGMAYGPARALAGASPPFTNVYVTRDGYRSFMQAGVWPEGTAFFLEIRQGLEGVSITSTGQSQGNLLRIEAAVKDSKRNPEGGWAYFDFGAGGKDKTARMLPKTESCYECHSKHGAVEWTFTQFYPEQFAVAQARGTVRKDYDPKAKAP